MASWTDEDKAKVIAAYKAKNPTPETSTEIIKEIAEEMGQSPNGIRMILVQANAYVKKEAAKTGEKKEGTEGGTKRVSKETSINALREAIKSIGADVDDEILEKLTGKAAVYFTKVLESKE